MLVLHKLELAKQIRVSVKAMVLQLSILLCSDLCLTLIPSRQHRKLRDISVCILRTTPFKSVSNWQLVTNILYISKHFLN